MLKRKIDLDDVREDFPIFRRGVIYVDSACMALKPLQVISASNKYYEEFPACAGRSVHSLTKKLTEEINLSRKNIAKFFGAKSKEIVFTRNTTESINLIAHSLDLKKGDVVITSDKEHNSNLLPWQKMVTKKGIIHKVVVSKKDNTFDLDKFEKILDAGNVKLVSIVYTSNLDGITNPIREIIRIAHKSGALVLVDAAQAAPHMEINVKKLDVDFLACSGHKMAGPSGIGLLYGKYELLEKLDPFLVGGETVFDSTYDSASWEKPPLKFEAGLQNYSGILGFSEAINYLKKIGMKVIAKHESELNEVLTKGLSEIKGIEFISDISPSKKSGIVSFNIKGIDPHQIALMLNSSANIMCRSGAHCVHSWFNSKGLDGCVRFSLYFYNTKEECLVIIERLKEIIRILRS